MLTYTQLYTRAADICGFNVSPSSIDLTNIQQDINPGVRLFKNAARRYWTRIEKATNLVASQQYYTLPPDCVRITEVKATNGSLIYPLTPIDSEMMWNKFNIIPSITVSVPSFYFVRGYNEVGIYPIPPANVTNGLIVSYEPRLQDMSIDDVTTGTVTVTNGSTTVTNSGNNFTSNMIGRWFQITSGQDGSWYRVATFTSATTIGLETDYAGVSGAVLSYVIGQAPDIPEDYHLGMVYYAAYNFFLKRNADAKAGMYNALFQDLLTQYKDTYSAKNTGIVQTKRDRDRYNLFSIPPNAIT